MGTKPVQFTKATNSLMREVISTNPLFVFRKRQNPAWSLRTAGIYIGVTAQAVSNWESGAMYPDEGNMRSIARVLETSPEKLTMAWDRWLQKVRDIVETA